MQYLIITYNGKESEKAYLYIYIYNVVIVQLLSRIQLFVTSWTAARQAPLFSTISWSLLKFMSIESVVVYNHLLLCCPLSSCPQSFPASGSFPTSWLFTSGDQSIGASASASVLPRDILG